MCSGVTFQRAYFIQTHSQGKVLLVLLDMTRGSQYTVSEHRESLGVGWDKTEMRVTFTVGERMRWWFGGYMFSSHLDNFVLNFPSGVVERPHL